MPGIVAGVFVPDEETVFASASSGATPVVVVDGPIVRDSDEPPIPVSDDAEGIPERARLHPQPNTLFGVVGEPARDGLYEILPRESHYSSAVAASNALQCRMAFALVEWHPPGTVLPVLVFTTQ